MSFMMKLLELRKLRDTWACLFFIIIATIGAFLFSINLGINWVPVEGKVLRTVQIRQGSQGSAGGGSIAMSISAKFCWTSEIEYRVNNIIYKSTEENFGKDYSFCSTDYKQIPQFSLPAVGSKVIIWYDVKKPERAVQKVYTPWIFIFGMFVCLSVVFLFLYVIFWNFNNNVGHIKMQNEL